MKTVLKKYFIFTLFAATLVASGSATAGFGLGNVMKKSGGAPSTNHKEAAKKYSDDIEDWGQAQGWTNKTPKNTVVNKFKSKLGGAKMVKNEGTRVKWVVSKPEWKDICVGVVVNFSKERNGFFYSNHMTNARNYECDNL